MSQFVGLDYIQPDFSQRLLIKACHHCTIDLIQFALILVIFEEIRQGNLGSFIFDAANGH